MIYKEVVNYIMDLASKYVTTVKYNDKVRHSDQPNVPNIKFQMESESYYQNHRLELNFRISSKGNDLDMQDRCFQIGVNIINEINWPAMISVDSYDVVFFTEWSDNNESGCRFTLSLVMVEPYDYCK